MNGQFYEGWKNRYPVDSAIRPSYNRPQFYKIYKCCLYLANVIGHICISIKTKYLKGKVRYEKILKGLISRVLSKDPVCFELNFSFTGHFKFFET